jgi:hypothetical protein
MPNQPPVSRYLLLGLAVLMLGSALPDMELLWRQARQGYAVPITLRLR